MHNIFVHHKPLVFNVGDFLCTPKHYFKFYSDKRIVFIGGGVFYSYGIKRIDKYKDTKKVAWGIGSSFDLDTNNRMTDENKTYIMQTYDLYGTRDLDACFDGIDFLPCVSVFNNVTDIEKGDKTGVFLNFDSSITTQKVYEDICTYCKENNLLLGTNNLNEMEFKKQFARMDKIVTNSYHVAYWGLLSGREIILIGYSSKFRNLLKMFNINSNKLFEYRRGDPDELLKVFYKALEKQEFIGLINPEDYKDKFRQCNFEFAKKLKKLNIIQSFELIPQSEFQEKIRTIKYTVFLKILNYKNILYKVFNLILKNKI